MSVTSDVGKDGYEHWGSVSVNSFRQNSAIDELRSMTGSRSHRCFQTKMPPSEQCITQNYYVGTVNQTPGAIYQEETSHTAAVRPKVMSRTFGNSQRILSDSTQMHSGRIINPSPASDHYHPVPSTTEVHLQTTLAVTNWKIRGLQQKKKSMFKMPMELRKSVERDYNDNYGTYVSKANELQKSLDIIAQQNAMHVSNNQKKIAAQKLPGFGTTGKREFQVAPPIQEAPTFYMSQSESDFGTTSRAKTINMGAFSFTEKANILLEEQTIRKRSNLTGLKLPNNRCRETDFYGPLDGHHSKTPGVGTYHPPLFPEASFSESFNNLPLAGSRGAPDGEGASDRGLNASTFRPIPEGAFSPLKSTKKPSTGVGSRRR